MEAQVTSGQSERAEIEGAEGRHGRRRSDEDALGLATAHDERDERVERQHQPGDERRHEVGEPGDGQERPRQHGQRRPGAPSYVDDPGDKRAKRDHPAHVLGLVRVQVDGEGARERQPCGKEERERRHERRQEPEAQLPTEGKKRRREADSGDGEDSLHRLERIGAQQEGDAALEGVESHLADRGWDLGSPLARFRRDVARGGDLEAVRPVPPRRGEREVELHRIERPCHCDADQQSEPRGQRERALTSLLADCSRVCPERGAPKCEQPGHGGRDQDTADERRPREHVRECQRRCDARDKGVAKPEGKRQPALDRHRPRAGRGERGACSRHEQEGEADEDRRDQGAATRFALTAASTD